MGLTKRFWLSWECFITFCENLTKTEEQTLQTDAPIFLLYVAGSPPVWNLGMNDFKCRYSSMCYSCSCPLRGINCKWIRAIIFFFSLVLLISRTWSSLCLSRHVLPWLCFVWECVLLEWQFPRIISRAWVLRKGCGKAVWLEAVKFNRWSHLIRKDKNEEHDL